MFLLLFAIVTVTIVALMNEKIPGYRYLFTQISSRVRSYQMSLLNGNFTTHRRLQFEGMFETASNVRSRRKKGSGTKKLTRSQALAKAVDEIVLGSDRYNLWWLGPPEEKKFLRANWSQSHNKNQNAIFTMAVIQGLHDKVICSTPNDLILFLGSLRKVFDGDIVLAIESTSLSYIAKSILIHYRAIVYVIPSDLCSRSTRSIFCGSAEERVPASVFRYYLYELWAGIYDEHSNIMFTDFHDVIFQSDPFTYRVSEWSPDYQMVLFQEFHPNMVINRCDFNKRIMRECYGDEALRSHGSKVIVSSGAALGIRDAMFVWAHSMTQQLQDAPGRMVETRCLSGGIDHSFINYLFYSHALRPAVNIKLVPQGEGAVNTVGGLRPDTVKANLTGNLQSFWHILSNEGYILNWNGDISPAVHQADHFLDEFIAIADRRKVSPDVADRAWQALRATACLWGCQTSAVFTAN